MWLYCRKISVDRPAQTRLKGPLLIASNHPNSFLDAILLDILFEEPIHSLARGDAFVSPFVTRILKKLRILPVYRTSEGVENLSANYQTFDECIQLFRNQSVVLIFSEGLCENEWHLRPLKKGTARLALKAWEAGIPLKVLPVGLNYSSFRRTGKNIFLHFGDCFGQEVLAPYTTEGSRNLGFNARLRKELHELVYEIPFGDEEQMKEKLVKPTSLFEKIALAPFAALGALLHMPFYFPIRGIVESHFGKTVHYDSVMAAALLFTYPLYLLLLTGLTYWFTGSAWALLLLAIIPALGWCYQRLKPQLDHKRSKLYRNDIVYR